MVNQLDYELLDNVVYLRWARLEHLLVREMTKSLKKIGHWGSDRLSLNPSAQYIGRASRGAPRGASTRRYWSSKQRRRL